MTDAVICPGSFDPVTMGHIDIIERAVARFGEVVVAVMDNPRKQPLFSVRERIELIEQTTVHLPDVSIDRFDGLLVDYCASRGIRVVCKGLRAVSDFEYELQMAQMNQRMGDVETLFMSTSPEYSYLSSSLVKEVARYGGPLEGVVPEEVAVALRRRYGQAD